MENAEHTTSLHGWTQRMGLLTQTGQQQRQRYSWRQPCPVQAPCGVRPARGDACQPAAGTLHQGVKCWETNARSQMRACSSSSHWCGMGGDWRGDKYGEEWVGPDTNGDVLHQTKTQRKGWAGSIRQSQLSWLTRNTKVDKSTCFIKILLGKERSCFY